MKTSRVLVWLSSLIAVLALVAAAIGLFWQDAGSAFSFTTLRGESAQIYGQGMYRYDTLFAGAGNRGTDAVTLFLGIPLLVLSTLLYRRGSLKGALLLVGSLTWFLYVGASYALGAVAYNDLFLVYVALFSASLFTFVLAFTSIDVWDLRSRFSARMPRRGPAIFMFASSLLTLGVWLIEPVTSLIQGRPPEHLGPYTTLFTNALDMGIIVPATFLAGLLILRHNSLGYLIAFPLLVLEAMLAPMITSQTVSQVRGVLYNWRDSGAHSGFRNPRSARDLGHRNLAAQYLGFGTIACGGFPHVRQLSASGLGSEVGRAYKRTVEVEAKRE